MSDTLVREEEENIVLSPTAAAKALELLAQEEGMVGLRVGVKSGGCSGFQYERNADVKVADFEEVLV